MSDFDDLRQIREAKEKAEAMARQKWLEDERRQAEAAQRLRDKEIAAANRWDNAVVEVLKTLRDAVYPRYEIGGWAIGKSSLTEFATTYFESLVVVELEFDKNGEPRHFRVHREYANCESVRCGLSRDDLVRALRKLHPSRVVNQIPPVY